MSILKFNPFWDFDNLFLNMYVTYNWIASAILKNNLTTSLFYRKI